MELDLRLHLDIEINLENKVIARVMSFTPSLQDYKMYFNCHARAKAIQS